MSARTRPRRIGMLFLAITAALAAIALIAFATMGSLFPAPTSNDMMDGPREGVEETAPSNRTPGQTMGAPAD